MVPPVGGSPKPTVNRASKQVQRQVHLSGVPDRGEVANEALFSEPVLVVNQKVQDAAGAEIARITKTWAGWAKERFTKADNCVVQSHRPLEEPLRSLAIAAVLAIDTALKQGNQISGSWGTRRYK